MSSSKRSTKRLKASRGKQPIAVSYVQKRRDDSDDERNDAEDLKLFEKNGIEIVIHNKEKDCIVAMDELIAEQGDTNAQWTTDELPLADFALRVKGSPRYFLLIERKFVNPDTGNNDYIASNKDGRSSCQRDRMMLGRPRKVILIETQEAEEAYEMLESKCILLDDIHLKITKDVRKTCLFVLRQYNLAKDPVNFRHHRHGSVMARSDLVNTRQIAEILAVCVRGMSLDKGIVVQQAIARRYDVASPSLYHLMKVYEETPKEERGALMQTLCDGLLMPDATSVLPKVPLTRRPVKIPLVVSERTMTVLGMDKL
jgi:hypothetical protein